MELCSMLGQPGREGSLEEKGYVYMYGWVPSLFTWNYHNIVNQLYPKTKSFLKLKVDADSRLVSYYLLPPGNSFYIQGRQIFQFTGPTLQLLYKEGKDPPITWIFAFGDNKWDQDQSNWDFYFLSVLTLYSHTLNMKTIYYKNLSAIR